VVGNYVSDATLRRACTAVFYDEVMCTYSGSSCSPNKTGVQVDYVTWWTDEANGRLWVHYTRPMLVRVKP
jgi:hypothetical protein